MDRTTLLLNKERFSSGKRVYEFLHECSTGIKNCLYFSLPLWLLKNEQKISVVWERQNRDGRMAMKAALPGPA